MRRTVVLTAVSKAMDSLGRPSAGETVVVGLSGGPDSVALVDALANLAQEKGFRVLAAHLDHGLRADSAADAAFCANLCEGLGVGLRTSRADVQGRARQERGGIEEAARNERYGFLRRVKEAEGAVAIAVGHTRDDQVETLLLRLLRGAGASGLASMRRRSGDVIRPLLSVTREQVLAHLAARGLPCREDPTNADPTLLRNRVRQELLPYLESRFNPEIRGVLSRTAALLADEAEFLAEMGGGLLEEAGRREGTAIALSRSRLAAAPRALARVAVRRALKQAGGLRGVGAVHVERILDLAGSPTASGRRLPLPGGREAVVSFDELRLEQRSGPSQAFAYPLPVPGRVELPGGGAVIARTASGPAELRGGSAVVAAPEGPLVIRTRRPGDRVEARGRDVSLKRFLINRRVPADLRASLPLVASGHRVLWVPGQPVEAPAEGPCRFIELRWEGRA